MKRRGPLPNVSYFAFTATPKNKTLELFGTKRPDGKFEPFSLYSMRQAIEEKFILDVLENYTTYQSYWALLKKIKDDPHYDREKAEYLLKSFVGLSKHTINKKVGIMVEHFRNNVMQRIGGKAKAMIVTRSRLHAVRLQAGGGCVSEGKGLPVQVAGRLLRHGEGRRQGLHRSGHEQASRRPHDGGDVQAERIPAADRGQQVPDRLRPAAAPYHVCGQEARRRERGANAVPAEPHLPAGKEDTMVLDFANEAEEIQKAFQPYYERTLLKEATDPNLLYDLQTRLDGFHFSPRRRSRSSPPFISIPRALRTNSRLRSRRCGSLQGCAAGHAVRIPRLPGGLRSALRFPVAGHHLYRRRPGEVVRVRQVAVAGAAGEPHTVAGGGSAEH